MTPTQLSCLLILPSHRRIEREDGMREEAMYIELGYRDTQKQRCGQPRKENKRDTYDAPGQEGAKHL